MSASTIVASLMVALGIVLPQVLTPATTKVAGCSFGDTVAPAPSRAAATAMANDGPIREAARIDGRVVVQPRAYPESVVTTFEGLASHSDVIVVGEVVGCRGVDAGSRIGTVYRVSLEEGLKGGLRQGAVIEVEIFGGHMEYPGGYYAETRIPGFRPPELNDRLLLFLNRRSAVREGMPASPFILSFSWFSSFRLTASGVVDASYQSPDPAAVVSSTRGMPAEQLLARIREIVRRPDAAFQEPANRPLQPTSGAETEVE